jgi:hypothetical protein
MINRTVIVIAVVALVALSGCATYPSAPDHVVHFDGEFERSDSRFSMNGTVNFYLGSAGNRTVSNLSVVLYDAGQQQITSVELGNISVNGTQGPFRRPVRLENETLPAYVIIESPDAWGMDDVHTTGYAWDGTRYAEYAVASGDDRF